MQLIRAQNDAENRSGVLLQRSHVQLALQIEYDVMKTLILDLGRVSARLQDLKFLLLK